MFRVHKYGLSLHRKGEGRCSAIRRWRWHMVKVWKKVRGAVGQAEALVMPVVFSGAGSTSRAMV